MKAYTDPDALRRFADLLYRIADEGESADISIDDANEAGWMIPEGEAITVLDVENDEEWLVTAKPVQP